MSKVESMKTLKKGKGIQHLLDESHTILGNPLTVFDTDYNLIAYTDVPIDDSLWKELITTGTFSVETQLFFMNESITDDIANAKKTAMIKSEKLKYDRTLVHIFNGNGIKVANVLMLECNQAFDSEVLDAFYILADLIMDEIRDDRYYISYGEAYQNAWIKKLIDYDIEEKALYSPHVQILYNDFKTYLYLAVVDIAHSESHHNGHQWFVDLLRQKRTDFKYAVYDQYIVMILSTSYKTFKIDRELKGLVDYFVEKNIFVGISSCFDNLFELRRYYAEAVKALKSLKTNGNLHFSVYRQDIS